MSNLYCECNEKPFSIKCPNMSSTFISEYNQTYHTHTSCYYCHGLTLCYLVVKVTLSYIFLYFPYLNYYIVLAFFLGGKNCQNYESRKLPILRSLTKK